MSSSLLHEIRDNVKLRRNVIRVTESTSIASDISLIPATAGKRIRVVAVSMSIENLHTTTTATFRMRDGSGGSSVWTSRIKGGTLMSRDLIFNNDPIVLTAGNPLIGEVSVSHSSGFFFLYQVF